ncbi:MAG: helix-turn-helix domain-containing protein [Abitibacteriaceae bacterium]|nr:helix-turn-helix domain-containing protein [Abditibacteriaceae bacterium]MBV9867046.1 helix-turn-helix domain-containing protein [Abditibacteriaceae bacterium]
MKDELFTELLSSVREGGAILRGECQAARRFEVPAPDVRRMREAAGFSQREFATLLGISPATLRNWEQGRRQPEGAARVLLSIAAKHPQIVWNAVRPDPLQHSPMTPAKRVKRRSPSVKVND